MKITIFVDSMELKNILLADFTDYPAVNQERLCAQVQELERLAKKNILCGEFLYEKESMDSFSVSLQNVSHKINNICERNKKIYADVKFVETERGKIVKTLINEGFEPYFQIRATKNFRLKPEIENWEIFTWDVKLRPPTIFDRNEIGMFMKNSFKGLSKKYILDAVFNEEIQKNWKPKIGDIIIGPTGNIFVISAEHTSHKEMGGTKFFFGGGLCNRDGGNILNETFCYTMNESGRNYTWVDGEIRPINDPYHGSFREYRYVPYPHELNVPDQG